MTQGLVTVVRSLVGRYIDLPGNIVIRPWAFVEFRDLTDSQKVEISYMLKTHEVQVSQLRDGAPLTTVDLEVKDGARFPTSAP